MNKRRVVAPILWFFSTWYAWAMIAHFVDVSPAVGPILGVALAAFIAMDPLHRVWATTSTATTSQSIGSAHPGLRPAD